MLEIKVSPFRAGGDGKQELSLPGVIYARKPDGLIIGRDDAGLTPGYQNLDSNRTILGCFPTPVIGPLEQRGVLLLSQRLGAEVYFKLDECTGLGPAGGNKVRKLEYWLHHAQSQGATDIITSGGVQSNHCAQTAHVCQLLGLRCHIVYSGSQPESFEGNTSYCRDIFNAEIHFAGEQSRAEVVGKLQKRIASDTSKIPMTIPVGASDEIGSLGFVRAMFELREQLGESVFNSITRIYFASGSGGTHAGLVVGKLLSNWLGSIVALPVETDEATMLAQKVKELAGICLATYFNRSDDVSSHILYHDFNPGDYAVFNEQDLNATKLAETLGVPALDPVYTGRAFRGMCDHLSECPPRKGERILFWHTGGLAAWSARSRYGNTVTPRPDAD